MTAPRVVDPHDRHAVIVLTDRSQLALVVGDIVAAQINGTYDPANPPANPRPPIATQCGPGLPIEDANGLLAWGVWGCTQVFDTYAPDGTLLTEGSLTQINRLAQQGIVRVFIGGEDGQPSHTWKQDCGWVDRPPPGPIS